jgi:hypothetical protein
MSAIDLRFNTEKENFAYEISIDMNALSTGVRNKVCSRHFADSDHVILGLYHMWSRESEVFP